MASDGTPPGTIALRGAPDTYIGTPEAKARAVQVVQLDMSQDVVDELLRCTRDGKPPQILFGRNPVLRYNGRSRMLETASSKFRHELYQSSTPDSDQAWSFAGLINHTVAFLKTEEVTAGTDAALETLKSNLATFTQAKEARGTIISAELAPSTVKRSAAKSQKHSQFLKKPSLLGGVTRSSPSSPSSSALASPSLLPAPTSVPSVSNPDMEAQKALRKPLIHLLAIRPATRDELMARIRCTKPQCSLVLEKVARQVGGSDEWKLTDKAFKDLDVWAFKYVSQKEREAAIDNAVRAYDRMRLSKEDKCWQMLLPKEERGRGKVLSRLNIQDGSKGALTPNPSARLVDKKTGLPRKPAVKRTAKDGEVRTRDKKAAKQKGADLESKKVAKDNMVDSEDKRTAKERHMNGQASKTRQPGEARTSLSKAARESDASHVERTNGMVKPALKNKPKNPSPLSASPPVNASDLENDHPVHKALSAITSPKESTNDNLDKPLKRKANNLNHDLHEHDISLKQAKLDANEPSLKSEKPSSTSSSLNGTIVAKRKAQDVDSDAPANTPTKYRKLDASSRETVARRAAAPASQHSQRPDHSPQSDASTTPPVPLSYRQTIQLAQRFRTYYDLYQKLWHELSQGPDPPSEQKREELLRMHRKLEEMKRDINNGALRQWG